MIPDNRRCNYCKHIFVLVSDDPCLGCLSDNYHPNFKPTDIARKEINRLTARNKNGIAYLINVKSDEQEIESEYPNTLQCALDGIEELCRYEETGLTPAGIVSMQAELRSLKEAT
jgi:hypothetical protein